MANGQVANTRTSASFPRHVNYRKGLHKTLKVRMYALPIPVISIFEWVIQFHTYALSVSPLKQRYRKVNYCGEFGLDSDLLNTEGKPTDIWSGNRFLLFSNPFLNLMFYSILYFLWRNSPTWDMAAPCWGFGITQNDTPQLVRPLWTRDQPVAETCTSPHTQNT
jgi:hypothetical protein